MLLTENLNQVTKSLLFCQHQADLYRQDILDPTLLTTKTSDLNYIINTPGRRKNKQICLVNMLKEYFDRDSSISKPITVVNTVPQESNVFEPEVNSDFIDKSDPDSSKLENSDILRNLDNQLSHLEPSQQEELKQLIHEYEHLFPDIPTRTDKIYHDVIVEDSKPIKQHPYRMNPLKQKSLQDEVKYWKMTLLNLARVITVHHVY